MRIPMRQVLASNGSTQAKEKALNVKPQVETQEQTQEKRYQMVRHDDALYNAMYLSNLQNQLCIIEGGVRQMANTSPSCVADLYLSYSRAIGGLINDIKSSVDEICEDNDISFTETCVSPNLFSTPRFFRSNYYTTPFTPSNVTYSPESNSMEIKAPDWAISYKEIHDNIAQDFEKKRKEFMDSIYETHIEDATTELPTKSRNSIDKAKYIMEVGTDTKDLIATCFRKAQLLISDAAKEAREASQYVRIAFDLEKALESINFSIFNIMNYIERENKPKKKGKADKI